MKKILKSFIVLLLIIAMSGCNLKGDEENSEVKTYISITPQQAYEMMCNEKDYIILDVREQDEYDEGHIADALLMPYEQAETMAPNLVPDKTKLILVYCRSGRRSKIASQTLADMGYDNVYEFGGIIDWPYEIIQ